MTSTTNATVRVPLAIRHRPGRKTVVTPMTDGVAPVTTRADPVLVKALARAFRYRRMLDQGRYASISEMAEAERIERGYLGALLRLTLLAPDIIGSMLDGRASRSIPLPALLEPVPVAWACQRDPAEDPSAVAQAPWPCRWPARIEATPMRPVSRCSCMPRGTGCWWRSIAARRTPGHAARPQAGREWRILAASGDPARLGRVGGEWRWRCVTWLAEASLP